MVNYYPEISEKALQSIETALSIEASQLLGRPVHVVYDRAIITGFSGRAAPEVSRSTVLLSPLGSGKKKNE